MNLNEHLLEQFERYSKGQMNVLEQQLFESKLASDERLRHQLELSQIVDQMIVGEQALKLKEQMRKDLDKPRSTRGLYFLVIALLGSVGIATYCFTTLQNTTKSAEKEAQKDIIHTQTPAIITKAPEAIHLPATPKHKATIARTVPIAPSSPLVDVQPTAPLAIDSVPMLTTPFQPIQNDLKHPTAVAPTQSDPCIGVRGQVSIRTVPSCIGKENGELYISTDAVHGATAPITFELGERTSTSTAFDHLAAGTYSTRIYDAKHCHITAPNEVVITMKNCAQQTHYVFNPEHDLAWNIPYTSEKEAINVRILEKSGKLFYQSQVIHGLPAEWKGESTTGASLGMGLYLYTVEYADGSIEEGTLLVSR